MSAKQKNKRPPDEDGWEEWGGYFNAKTAKLQQQFKETASKHVEKLSEIFAGVIIFVNGLTHPNSEELKQLMAQHGGTFQVYQNSTTTHIIASNLPNVKINKLGTVPIVKPSWIVDSIALNKLLDYRRYLLYTNQSTTQPKLSFPVVPKLINSPPKTASDPRFLEEFYNNSRLHLIATIGAEFKQIVSDWREKSRGDFPGRCQLSDLNKGGAPTGTVIMHIDMDCFFVSVGLKNRPELKGLPVAVTHAKNPQINASKEREAAVTFNTDRMPEWVESNLIDGRSSMSEVASCSYEARKCGVKNGMFLGAAAKLCPNLKTIPYDFEGYKQVSTTLYTTIATYTLDIEPVSCDEMYVNVTSLLHTYNLSIPTFAEHIRNEISKVTGCPCSTGFGSNRLQARMATKNAKPNGMFHLKGEEVEGYMAEIPLVDLPGVGYSTSDKLRIMGMVTCGDVQVAALDVLKKELGNKIGETVWEQARGIDKKELSYTHERKSVSAEINYGIRFKTIEECWNFFESLGIEVWNRLSEIKMKARTITLKLMVRAQDAPLETAKFLGHGICDSLSKSTTLPHPLHDVRQLHKEVRSLYEKMNQDFIELRGIGIQLSKLEKIQPINPTLTKFLQQESKKPATRGPPPPPKKQKRLMNDFFKNKKENITINKLLLPPKSEISLTVLNELPDGIRNEIINELDSVPSKSQPITRSPFTGMSWPRLKPILYEWFRSGIGPKERDVIMLGEYFRQMALESDIGWLRIALNFLHRNMEQLGCPWHIAYGKLLDYTQQGMVMSYGKVLKVQPVYECCL